MRIMSGLKCFLYLTWNDSAYRIGMSHNPLLDLCFLQKKGYQKLQILSQALPVGTAYFLFRQIADDREKYGQPYVSKSFAGKTGLLKKAARFWLKNQWDQPVARLAEKKTKKLQHYCAKFHLKLLPPQGIISVKELENYSLPHSHDLQSVKKVLRGRLLFLEEIERALVEHGLQVVSPLEDVLQVLLLKGEIDMCPGITWEQEGPVCRRCGQQTGVKQTSCFDCGAHCFYCEECLSMGESRLCKPLYGLAAGFSQEQQSGNHRVQLDFTLTRAQKNAAIALKRFVREKGQQQCLVWAVCGAGKTEVVFWAAAEVLNAGGRVLYVSPRRDVILELVPRFERAFPVLKPLVLHGGQSQKFARSNLVLATSHQAIRFYRYFDLVILDEVDAYPYRGNLMLQHAVARATKSTGKTVYLTATPTGQLYKLAKQGNMHLIRIPARFHGYPLPVPELVAEKSLAYKLDGEVVLPGSVMDFVHRTVEGDLAQLFVFVPSVFLARRVGEVLQQLVKQPPFNDFTREWVQYSHSKDPLREEKRQRFVRGDFPIFVTTTIMERGITVERANVLVLFAETERIFDAGTLVQMAGRAGRSAAYPCGQVWFVGARITGSMQDAVAWIKEMNQEAYRLGYLKEEIHEACSDREVT